jgi:hypothetical protein
MLIHSHALAMRDQNARVEPKSADSEIEATPFLPGVAWSTWGESRGTISIQYNPLVNAR